METDEPGDEPEPNNGQAYLTIDTGAAPSVPGIWHGATIAVAAATAAVAAAAAAEAVEYVGVPDHRWHLTSLKYDFQNVFLFFST